MKTRIIPYTAVTVDASTSIFIQGLQKCLQPDTEQRRNKLQLEIITSLEENCSSNHFYFPCLSVRTALDAFFTVQNFPPGSEIIITAINIPDVPKIILEHQLTYVPLDLDLQTLTSKADDLEKLITNKTVAVIITHLYGKQIDCAKLCQITKKHGLFFIEDMAESFFDFKMMGNHQSDLALFSFGVIKNYTAFGGGIMKVRDKNLHRKMVACFKTYPLQSQFLYLQKIFKYFFVYALLDIPTMVNIGLKLSRALNTDHKKFIVKKLRGFPQNLFFNIRHQPCAALLEMLLCRLKLIDDCMKEETKAKGDFAVGHLPVGAQTVGANALYVNYWLFPVLVDNPNEVVKEVNQLGIDAFRGATQLNIIEPMEDYDNQYFPSQAKYLIDHVIYLPVNRFTPYDSISYICWGLNEAVKKVQMRRIQAKL